jgi:hypothetical protein
MTMTTMIAVDPQEKVLENDLGAEFNRKTFRRTSFFVEETPHLRGFYLTKKTILRILSIVFFCAYYFSRNEVFEIKEFSNVQAQT